MADLFSEKGIEEEESGSGLPIISWNAAPKGTVISGVLMPQLDGREIVTSVKSHATDVDGNKLFFDEEKTRPRPAFTMELLRKPNDFADCSTKHRERAIEKGLVDDGRRLLKVQSFAVNGLIEGIKAYIAEHGKPPKYGDFIFAKLTSTSYGSSGKGKMYEYSFKPGTEESKAAAAKREAEIKPAPAVSDFGSMDELPPF